MDWASSLHKGQVILCGAHSAYVEGTRCSSNTHVCLNYSPHSRPQTAIANVSRDRRAGQVLQVPVCGGHERARLGGLHVRARHHCCGECVPVQ